MIDIIIIIIVLFLLAIFSIYLFNGSQMCEWSRYEGE
jgi:hypothetical protein